MFIHFCVPRSFVKVFFVKILKFIKITLSTCVVSFPTRYFGNRKMKDLKQKFISLALNEVYSATCDFGFNKGRFKLNLL